MALLHTSPVTNLSLQTHSLAAEKVGIFSKTQWSHGKLATESWAKQPTILDDARREGEQQTYAIKATKIDGVKVRVTETEMIK